MSKVIEICNQTQGVHARVKARDVVDRVCDICGGTRRQRLDNLKRHKLQCARRRQHQPSAVKQVLNSEVEIKREHMEMIVEGTNSAGSRGPLERLG